MIPGEPFPVNGLPVGKAPPYLQPYLDCCEGASAVGGTVRDGEQLTSIWALFRAGEAVGLVTIDHRELMTPPS